jgi:SAM-dependent methyltransferase
VGWRARRILDRARRSLRYPHLLALDIRDRLRGERSPLVPPRRYQLPGWQSDFAGAGRRWLAAIEREAGLRGDERILDIGCGPGRIASALIERLPRGSYEGIDVDERSIGWCRERITPRYPRFRFHHVDVANPMYNPAGGEPAGGYRFPFGDGEFDLAIALSLFTHMAPSETEHYLAEAARVLRPGGRVLASFFLVDEGDGRRDWPPGYEFTQRLLDEGGTPYLTLWRRTPELIVGQLRAELSPMAARAGLSVEAVRAGAWRSPRPWGRDGRLNQDLVVAVAT